MKPTFRQSINNMVENRNFWIVLCVKGRCSQLHSIEVTLNKMSLFYFIQRNDQIKHEKVWEDFQSWLFSSLDFYSSILPELEFSRATLFFHEPWKNEFDLDLTLSVALGCFVDFITVLDVDAKWEEGNSKHGSSGI